MSDAFWISAAVKAEPDMRLSVIGVPFGTDRQGQYFDESTYIDMEPGEERPVYYFHGFAERAAKAVRRLGKAIYRGVGELNGVRGHLFEVTLNRAHEMAQSVYAAAKAGIARASSDSTVHLTRPEGIVGKPGRVDSWPVIGISLMDEATAAQAVNPRAIALAAAKAILAEGDEVDADAAKAGQVFAKRNRERILRIREALDELLAEFPDETGPDQAMTDAVASGAVVELDVQTGPVKTEPVRDEIAARVDALIAERMRARQK